MYNKPMQNSSIQHFKKKVEKYNDPIWLMLSCSQDLTLHWNIYFKIEKYPYYIQWIWHKWYSTTTCHMVWVKRRHVWVVHRSLYYSANLESSAESQNHKSYNNKYVDWFCLIYLNLKYSFIQFTMQNNSDGSTQHFIL